MLRFVFSLNSFMLLQFTEDLWHRHRKSPAVTPCQDVLIIFRMSSMDADNADP